MRISSRIRDQNLMKPGANEISHSYRLAQRHVHLILHIKTHLATY